MEHTKRKYSESLFTGFKILVLGGALYYIYFILQGNENLNEQFIRLFTGSLSVYSLPLFALLMVLMLCNWGIEAFRWRFLVSRVQYITFPKAFKSVLTGLAFSFFSEQNLGTFFGRVWQLPTEDRYKALGLTIAGGICQNYITYVAGGLGLVSFLYKKAIISSSLGLGLLSFTILIAIGGLLLLAQMNKLKTLIERLPRFKDYLLPMTEFSPKEILYLIGMSLLRYGIFFFQFYSVFLLLQVLIPVSDFLCGISLVYLSKSLVPKFSFLSDLGIREFSALFFLGQLGLEDPVILTATLSLWLINILLPTFWGLYYSWHLPVKPSVFKIRTPWK
ncbi:hypothetical protein AAG747_01495 [Rapidithrix thailandica]|uniref:Flippase-like domain-containing protein n=1 Tax=Rapidithrix thailandica TaxID=413964 RepID=A0AAW9RYS8_9BACT